jgi:hypothetical protein
MLAHELLELEKSLRRGTAPSAVLEKPKIALAGTA